MSPRTPTTAPGCGREFVRALAAELAAVHDYNQGRDWASQKSVQTYVYDTYEEDLFIRLLEEALEDPATAEDALRLAVLLPGPRASPRGPATRQRRVPFPLIVLTREIRRLLALPVPLPSACRGPGGHPLFPVCVPP